MMTKTDGLATWGFILFLTVSAFVIRLDNFYMYKIRHMITVDENVFYTIAVQLTKNPFDYNTRLYLEKPHGKNIYIPPYMHDPLFKHPPLFSWLNALSMKILGKKSFSVVFVSLMFGCLMIPLIFFLGEAVSGRTAGLLAAFLAWLDPVSTICSQKVWMATTLTFFTTLSVYFYVRGLKKEHGSSFFWGGIAAGLAALTKYPGVLPVVAVGLWALLFRKDLFLRQKFVLSLFVPPLMMLPWLYWNLAVYGPAFVTRHFSEHGFSGSKVTIAVAAAGILAAVGIFTGKWVRGLRPEGRSTVLDEHKIKMMKRAAILLTIICLLPVLKKSMPWNHLPLTSWVPGEVSRGATVFFYVTKMLEYSMIYIFAYIAFFMSTEDKARDGGFSLVKTAAFVVMIFYSIYGNYQMRYILMAVPLLALLAGCGVIGVVNRIREIREEGGRDIALMILMVFLMYALAKTMWINFQVSYPHDMCYF